MGLDGWTKAAANPQQRPTQNVQRTWGLGVRSRDNRTTVNAEAFDARLQWKSLDFVPSLNALICTDLWSRCG
jgi:hypothetical protein